MITKSPGKYNAFEEMLVDARELYIQLSNETRYKEGRGEFPYSASELYSLNLMLNLAYSLYTSLYYFVNPE